MQRKIAIDLISKSKIHSLSAEERQSIILSWWSIDESTPEFSELPFQLRAEIKNSENPPEDSTLLDPLVLLGLAARYIGVRNIYLEEQLKKLNIFDIKIEEEPEKLVACPCCRYRTLEVHGQYLICPVCFWEDSGQDNPDKYSSPNRMTLKEAQANFETYGAMSERGKRFVDPEGTIKWEKAT